MANKSKCLSVKIRFCASVLLMHLIILTNISAQPLPWSKGAPLFEDSFEDLSAWVVEQMPGGTAAARGGKLEIDDAKGCTVWFRHKLQAPLMIEYEATMIKAGGPNDNTRDLNCFWMATDPQHPADIFRNTSRGGKFRNYDSLRLYYTGYGGNKNTTTRFRRYNGLGNRPLLPQHDLSQPEYMLKPNKKMHIQIVCLKNQTQYIRDGKVIFDFTDSQPYNEGWFGFRTVSNHMTIDNFKITRLTSPDWPQFHGPNRNNISTAETVMVPMRDGTKLATQIWLPDGPGPWPTIMIRTPYGRPGMENAAKASMHHGYACVVQDFRGRFDSQGQDWPVFLHGGWGEHQDGYDTVEWIAKQPWSDEKVAAFGISGPGIAVNMLAPSRPPHLTCMFVSVAFSSMYHESSYQGGAFRKSLVENWLNGNKFHPKTLEITRAHPNYDDFWQSINPHRVMHRINVPAMYVGGWYDIFSAGTLNSFDVVHHHADKPAKGNCRLVMEAYGHGTCDEFLFPNPKTPPSANVFKWFDVWMKNDGKGAEDIPVVHYYTLGDPDDKNTPGNEWRTAKDWPIPAKNTPLYLRKNGKLAKHPVRRNNASLSYQYDPANPVPTIGGANLTIEKGPRDQRPVENRPDVLLFTSDKLTDYLQITGKVTVKLWASSSALNTDFTAKLCDVYPDGRSMIVLDGIIRATHRNSMETSEPLEPHKIYPFEIDLWSTSIVFSPGHKIRVTISSSNAPRFEPNPNTGKPSAPNQKTIVATNKIFMDNDHPSQIILPVVENQNRKAK